MAEKRRVISPDLVIHPGETIYDISAGNFKPLKRR